MRDTILFDLGNTLAEYFPSRDAAMILNEAMPELRRFLRREGLLHVSEEEMWRAVEGENYESADNSVRPLESRLLRIFRLRGAEMTQDLKMSLCARFMAPVFTRGRCYEDTLPALGRLREEGFRTAIISNAPWGCPASLCREEAERLGLDRFMDAVVFCTDVGWRKPAPQIFQHTLDMLGVTPEQCVFVGDHPEWDLAGPRALQIRSVLLDRDDVRGQLGEEPIRSLEGLWSRL